MFNWLLIFCSLKHCPLVVHITDHLMFQTELGYNFISKLRHYNLSYIMYWGKMFEMCLYEDFFYFKGRFCAFSFIVIVKMCLTTVCYESFMMLHYSWINVISDNTKTVQKVRNVFFWRRQTCTNCTVLRTDVFASSVNSQHYRYKRHFTLDGNFIVLFNVTKFNMWCVNK